MSQQLINHSKDLSKLRDEGYNLTIKSGFLLVCNVPYVNTQKQIHFGTLIMPLDLAGDVTVRPSSHVCDFKGEHPCNADGNILNKIRHSSAEKHLADGIISNHSFSAKTISGYSDYYVKVTTYANIISSYAKIIDPTVTPKTFPVVKSDIENHQPFKYFDTSSSRVGITNLTHKLEVGKIAIIGLGGTGSYILDLIAKTPVKEIHLYDSDQFLQHNAFRSPGAPSVDQLKLRELKVSYFKEIYSKMHNGIVEHPFELKEDNASELLDKSFAFICIHSGPARRVIIDKMNEFNIPYVDVGMGMQSSCKGLGGIIRVTASTQQKRDHVNNRISFGETVYHNEYSTNIQIADLNALNATLAVIRWKKFCGFYRDDKSEHNSLYTISTNQLLSEEIAK